MSRSPTLSVEGCAPERGNVQMAPVRIGQQCFAAGHLNGKGLLLYTLNSAKR